MSIFKNAVCSHLREFVAANCPKLKCDRAHQGVSVHFISRDGHFVVNMVILDGLFILGIDSNRYLPKHLKRWDLEVPISEPDSLDQIETFLRELHDQLP